MAPKNLLLTACHCVAPVQQAQDHVNKMANNWGKIFFSDETPLHLVQITQHQYFHSVHGCNKVQNIIQLHLQGDRRPVMVWDTFSAAVPLVLHHVEGTPMTVHYMGVIQQHIQPYFEAHLNHLFQYDNSTSHTASHTINWLEEQHIQVMQWPAVSPDLNPIKN